MPARPLSRINRDLNEQKGRDQHDGGDASLNDTIRQDAIRSNGRAGWWTNSRTRKQRSPRARSSTTGARRCSMRLACFSQIDIRDWHGLGPLSPSDNISLGARGVWVNSSAPARIRQNCNVGCVGRAGRRLETSLRSYKGLSVPSSDSLLAVSVTMSIRRCILLCRSGMFTLSVTR